MALKIAHPDATDEAIVITSIAVSKVSRYIGML
jgi:hypothetical protein